MLHDVIGDEDLRTYLQPLTREKKEEICGEKKLNK